MNALKSVSAIMVGALSAGFVVTVVEGLGHRIWPPADMEGRSLEQLQAVVDSQPLAALMLVPLAWFIGTLTGGLMAAKLSPDRPYPHALVVVILMSLGGIAMLMLVRHPMPVNIAGLLSFPLAARVISRKLAAIT